MVLSTAIGTVSLVQMGSSGSGIHDYMWPLGIPDHSPVSSPWSSASAAQKFLQVFFETHHGAVRVG